MCFGRREVQYRKHALKGSINDAAFAEEALTHKKKAFGARRIRAEKTILLSWKLHCISFHVYTLACSPWAHPSKLPIGPEVRSTRAIH